MANSACAQFDPQMETIGEFIERFKVQCNEQITKAGDDQKKKAAILVKSLPINVVTDLQRRIKPTKLSEATYDVLENKLVAQYEVKKSLIGASVQFLNRKQGPNESIEQYAKIINDLANNCKYEDCCRDRLIRDAFVSGLRSSAILSSLITECESKSFNDCVERAKLVESAAIDAQDIKLEPSKSNGTTNKVNAAKSNDATSKVAPTYKCIRCGTKGKHLARNCWAINLTCYQCEKQGHVSSACISKKEAHRREKKKVSKKEDSTQKHIRSSGRTFSRDSTSQSETSENGFENFLY